MNYFTINNLFLLSEMHIQEKPFFFFKSTIKLKDKESMEWNVLNYSNVDPQWLWLCLKWEETKMHQPSESMSVLRPDSAYCLTFLSVECVLCV